MWDLIKNFSVSTVATAPSPASSGTSLVVQSGDGSKFPSPVASPTVQTFNAVIWPAAANPLATNAEIVKVTAISTDTFTIVRQQEGTNARTILVGDNIALLPTGAKFTQLQNAIPAAPNLLKNGNFVNVSTNGYGGLADDWISSNANPVQGGMPELTPTEFQNVTGIAQAAILGMWSLNNTLADQSSNAYTLTASPSAPTDSSDGLLSQAKVFAAASSQRLYSAAANIINVTGSQTWIAFVKPTSLTGGVVMGIQGSGAVPYRDIGFNATGFAFNLPGLTTNPQVVHPALTLNKWHMVVGVYDSANSLLKLWVNGSKVQVTASGSSNVVTGNFAIGAIGDNGSFSDEVVQNAMVLNVAMTDAQVQSLWAYTTHKGHKIRRAGTDAVISQSLPQHLVERLRGKTLALRADVFQTVASTAQISITDDTSETASVAAAATQSGDTFATIGVSKTISATTTQITVKIKHSTSDGNTYVKNVALYEGTQILPFDYAKEDWSRFPSLLKLTPPPTADGYQFEEKRWFFGTPRFTGFATPPTVISRFAFQGNICHVVMITTAHGISNATSFTVSLPIAPLQNIQQFTGGGYRDNGAYGVNPPAISSPSGTVVGVSINWSRGGGWTASGEKSCDFDMFYEF